MQHAVATFDAMRSRRLFDRRSGLYGRRRWVRGRAWEALWPFGTAWSAVSTLRTLEPGVRLRSEVAWQSFARGLWAYARPSDRAMGDGAAIGFECRLTPPLGGGGERFYDDNAWIGLALMDRYRQADDPEALSLARRVLDFDLQGWASGAEWTCPGGIRWKEPASCTSRNTCSNAPVAELALLLHLATGDPTALEWGVRIYDWVRSCLATPDGLYLDRIAQDGTISPEIWSYNQGTMLGAGVLLHRITGDGRYLDHARATAVAGAARFGLRGLLGQAAAFNAVWFRNLLLLGEVEPDPRPIEMASEYGGARWDDGRDPRTGLFGGEPALNDTAAMVQIYALVAGAAPHP